MANPDYMGKQSLLDSVKYLDTIQKREEIFRKIQNLENTFNPDLVDYSVIQDRKNIYEDLKMLETEVNLRESNFDKLEQVSSKFKEFKDEKEKALSDERVRKIKNIELNKRKYQIIRYQNFLNEETKHLLWTLLVILIIDSLIVLCNLLNIPGFEKATVLAIIFGSLGLYGIYLFKKLIVDNVNIDIYNIDQHNYAKPTNSEVQCDRTLTDKLLGARNPLDCGNMDTNTYSSLEQIKNEELEKVKEDLGKPDDTKCLKLTMLKA